MDATTIEVYLYGCPNCGIVVMESQPDTSRRCKTCIVGQLRLITLVAQHEFRVRVKLEITP